MRRILTVLLLLGALGRAWGGEPSWTGSWDTRWRDGGARMDLVQQGGHVTGAYPAYGGRIDGQAHGRELVGHWTEGTRSGGITFVLAPDGRSFMGRFDDGQWWTGGRAGLTGSAVTVDQSGAREALRTFLDGGNAARAGALDQIAAAAAVVDFGPGGDSLVPGQRLAAARALFDVVDLTTFQLWTIPGKRAQGPSLPLRLHQAGTDAGLTLTLVQHPDGRWFVAEPDPAALAAARRALLARSGGRPPPPDAYLERNTPRDAMRSFVAGMDDWNGGGQAQAVAALDLSGFSAATAQYEGTLAAQYLDEIMDRVGGVVPQEIPDDPASRDPYLVLSHPAGDVVIVPPAAGPAGHGWRFAADTVRRARDIYAAVEDMPLAVGDTQPPPRSAYFRARRLVHDHAPALLARIGDIQVWQLLGVLAILAASALVALVAGALLLTVLRRIVGGRQIPAERELRWPLRLALTFALYKLAAPFLGLDERPNRISVGVSGIVLAVAVIWGGWKLTDALGDGYVKRAENSRGGGLDAITVLLVLTACKIVLLGGGLLFIANELSLPYGGVVAGLGIGGLAVAFASKETLSNVFGAALLAADRPFRRGDWIAAGDVAGTVEHVGIRSTRIRTAADSLMFVPNGKLADATLNNLGTRRLRLVDLRLLLAHGSTPTQVEAFVAALPDLVAATPRTLAHRTASSVGGVTADGIEVGLTCYLDAPVYAEELASRTTLMLGILRLAERLGITLGHREPAQPLPAAPTG